MQSVVDLTGAPRVGRLRAVERGRSIMLELVQLAQCLHQGLLLVQELIDAALNLLQKVAPLLFLGRIGVVEIEILFDLAQRKAQPLATQD